ncbi:MAG: very short patch repair endonuclease [Nanoarchaeota archaeon]|nr:very short patch repair endonuclease [Nanoarchaeota archaeon]
MDNLTKKQRSYCMSQIKSFGTKVELKSKKELKSFVYQPNLYGRPDFAELKNKTIIFIDGCFWHKCPKHYIKPKSNKHYWLPKLEKNVLRAKEVNLNYKASGWNIVRIWEHELK